MTFSQQIVIRTRVLGALLGAALAVSVVHYADNVARYDDFVVADGGPSTFGWISRWMVAASWVVFTACAVVGWRRFRQQRWQEAAAWIGAYSVSGLAGLAHYVDIPLSQLSAFQNAHVIGDIVLGLALVVSAVHLAFRPPRPGPKLEAHETAVG